jgi:hypothetical protein
MSERIYISGKITGIENDAELLFTRAENQLRSFGFDVINPMKIQHGHDKSWSSYMKADIMEMLRCDSVYMLSNWFLVRCSKSYTRYCCN